MGKGEGRGTLTLKKCIALDGNGLHAYTPYTVLHVFLCCLLKVTGDFVIIQDSLKNKEPFLQTTSLRYECTSGAHFTKDITTKIPFEIHGYLSRKVFCETGPKSPVLLW